MKHEDQRSVTVGAKSYDAMWADFAARNAVEVQPEGSITAAQYAERFGGTRDSAKAVLARLPSKLMRLRVSDQARNVRVYFLKEAA